MISTDPPPPCQCPPRSLFRNVIPAALIGAAAAIGVFIAAIGVAFWLVNSLL